jgi:hypothetical protein
MIRIRFSSLRPAISEDTIGALDTNAKSGPKFGAHFSIAEVRNRRGPIIVRTDEPETRVFQSRTLNDAVVERRQLIDRFRNIGTKR